MENNITELAGSARSSWYQVLIISLILAAGFIFRSWDISADPPYNLSWSDAPFTDGGLHICGARNIVLFGKEKFEVQPERFEYPFLHYSYLIVFNFLGVGFTQVRMTMVMYGILCIFLVYKIMKPGEPWYVPVISSLFLSINYIFAMYNRIPIVETIYIFFSILTIYFYQQSSSNPRFAIVAGLSFSVASFWGKLHAFFMAPAFFLIIGYHVFNNQLAPGKTGRKIGYYMLTGFMVGFLLWVACIFIPWRKEYMLFIKNQVGFIYPGSDPAQVQSVPLYQRVYETFVSVFTIGSKVEIFFRMPVTALLAFISFFQFEKKNRVQVEPRALISLRHVIQAWFIGGLILLITMKNQPLRYYLFTIPSICMLATYTLRGTFQKKHWYQWNKKSSWRSWFNFFVLFFIVNQFVLLLHFKLFPFFAKAPVSVDYLTLNSFGFSMPASVILFVLLHYIPFKPLRLPFKSIGVICIAFILLIQGYQWVRWVQDHGYQLPACARDIERCVGNDAILSGSIAGTLGFGNSIYVSPRVFSAMKERKWTEFFFSHMLLDEGEYLNTMINMYGDLMKKAVYLKSYQVGRIKRHLFLINKWPRVKGSVYQPTFYELGREAQHNKKWELAKKYFLKHIQRYPEHAESLFRLAQLEYHLDNIENVKTYLVKANLNNKKSFLYFDVILDNLIKDLADYLEIKL